MDNLSKIKKNSKRFHMLITFFMAAIPLYYLLYWLFINQLPNEIININTTATPLIPEHVSPALRVAGLLCSLLPLSALTYGLITLRKLFAHYNKGEIFSFTHVRLFKSTAKALVLWVVFSILYESAKSVIFTIGNPPGERMISVGFSSPELTTLVVAGIVFFIAWVMDEGRALSEESQFTV
ncbi:DUF2975 domain-containing protein [Desulfoluna spongiiphila]|uniref:DUF2975 domain-containing protein n=1 Tax=Desulfoluna spongiiphila TaxID=419481 RepID=A0A1G5F6E7_9BACT|nr:DUF2975 domain-containing protein [Desulfoluna spongiiphila]SCY34805.1 Protein of unknown function [Desulfoluna spongiiphila]VVS94271.1 protein of unknown function duf2975 [Desulfoluna spongiiphila]